MSAPTSPAARRDSRAETNVVVWAAISAVGVLLASGVLLIALSLLSWATDRPAGSTAGSASQVAVQAWYLAHSVSLPVAWGALSVPPLLITAFIALLFYRSARGAARACAVRTPAQVAEALAAIVITYVTCAILLSGVAYSTDPLLSVWDIVVGTGSLALVASLAGLLRESGLGARLVGALPGPSYAYARGALAAGWALGGMAAVAVGVSLLIGYSETSALTAALSPDGLGGLTVIGISIGYLPNAMLLATALGSGAGFDLGQGSLYSLGTVDREPLPLFPLFAALPQAAGGLALLTVLVPLVAAVVGALTMTRHLEPEHRTVTNLLIGSVGCGVLVAGGVLGVAWYAAGGLGDGRLSAVGASPWRLAGFLAVELAVAVAAIAFVATRRSLKPVSVARREKALSVLETGHGTGSTPDAGAADGPAPAAGKGAGAAGKGVAGAVAAGKGSGAAGKGVAGAVAAGKGSGAAEAAAAKKGATASSASESGESAARSGAPASARSGEGRRPVILSKLAMRRLARGAKHSATAKNAAAIKKQPTAAPKTAPAASLSVVKRAREAGNRDQSGGSTSARASGGSTSVRASGGSTSARAGAASRTAQPKTGSMRTGSGRAAPTRPGTAKTGAAKCGTTRTPAPKNDATKAGSTRPS